MNLEVPVIVVKSNWYILYKDIYYLNIIPNIISTSGFSSLETGKVIIQIDDYKFNYKLSNNKVSADGEPYLYWEFFNDKDKTYNIKGNYIPDIYDINYENDILEQFSYVKWGSNINFDKLDHINTSVTVNLIKGKGFYEGEWNINNILIKGKDIYKTDVIFEQNKPIIIKPVKLNSNSEFVVNLLNKDISIKLTTLIIDNNLLTELKANTNYVFNLTIDKTGTTNISISYSDAWNNKEVGGTVIY
jgi:hypothetical protein